jgi:LacI family transcriptional regulator
MAVTIKDIAAEAGVTPSTVSRALNSRNGVSETIRQKVVTAATRLNYKPNMVARGLVTGRSHSIGLLVSDIRNPFFAELARGAEDAAQAAGYELILCNSDLDREKQMAYFRSLLSKHVSGVLMNSVSVLDASQLSEIHASGVPVAAFTESRRHRFLSTVVCDNFRGGTLAGEYLVGLGHHRMAHLTGSSKHPALAERARGFVKAVHAACPCAEVSVLHGEHNLQGGHKMALRALAARPRVTAISAGNDFIAFGAMRAIFEAGLRVPEDVSLIGFDDVELASVLRPSLTTIRQPTYDMGHAAVEIVLKQARQNKVLPEHRAFDVELVERQSCQGLPGRETELRTEVREAVWDPRRGDSW